MRKFFIFLGMLLCSHFSVFASVNETCQVYSGGTITAPSSVCSGQTFTVDSSEPASSDGTTEYAWIVSYDGPTWSLSEMEYTNSETFTTTINQTTWFRRCAGSEGCNNIGTKESNWIEVSPSDCSNVCDVYSAGEISASNSICSGEEFTVQNTSSGSAENGVEYAWIVSTDGPTWSASEMVYSNSETFTTSITQTTWFRRCAGSEGCNNIGTKESNWIEVNPTDCNPCGTIAGIYIYDQATDQTAYGPLINGEQINVNDLPSEYYLVLETAGNIESVAWTVDNQEVGENNPLYTFPGGAENNNNWQAGIGTHTISASAFLLDNCVGTPCETTSVSIELIQDCASMDPNNLEFNCEFNINHTGWFAEEDCIVDICEDQKIYYSTPGCDDNLNITVTGPNGYNQTRNGGCHDFLINENMTQANAGEYTAEFTNSLTGCSVSKSFTINVLDSNSGPCGVAECNSIVLDQWHNTNSCHICNDEFTSTILDAYGGAAGDVISFQDPLCNEDCITAVTVTFNLAAADFELDQDPNNVDQLDINYPIELNGQVIGHYNPTELPYTCNLCESDATKTVTFEIDSSTFSWNYGGTNELDINFYEFGNDNNTLQDVCVANVALEFQTAPCSVLTPPSEPTCNNGSFLWQNSVDVTDLNGTYGIPQADVRLTDYGTSNFLIPGPYPASFDGPVNISIDQVVSWDGYLNRPNVGDQNNEQWKIIFLKDGELQFSSDYTEDIGTGTASEEWIGALNQDILLPNGTDEIRIIHYENSTYGTGSSPTANSVVPISICISHNIPCQLEVELGENIDLCGSEATLTAEISGESECEEMCEYAVSAPDRCGSNGSFVFWIQGAPGGSQFSSTDAQFYELSNGTAKFIATATNGTDNIEVDITYSDRTTTSPADSPKLNECENTNDNDWIYYQTTNGILVSENHGTFSLTRNGPAFQLGHSAMHIAPGFGASGWLIISGGDGTYSNGDVNIALSEECTTTVGAEPAYLWSNGETTPEITVTESGVYSVIVTDCNGCIAMDEVVVNLTNAPEVIANNLTESVTVSQGENFPDVTFDNGEVISYSENESASICEIVLSSNSNYNWRNLWFHAFPEEYNKNFLWQDGYVMINEDGTAEIFGKITNVDLPESGFHLHYYFEELEEFDPWIAGGGYENTDPDAEDRLYGRVDFNKPNSIVGFGEFADSDLQLISTGNVAHMDYGPRNVYGGLGVGFWIDYEGTVNGMPAGNSMSSSGANHNDMYSALGECVEAPEADCEELIVRHWVVENACGVQCTYVQAVTVTDTEPPVVVSGPEDALLECSADVPALQEPVFTDNNADELIVTFEEETTDLDCGFELTRTWTATDACGNSTTYTQTITTNDTEAPTLIGVPADEALQCGEEPTPAIVVAQDNCTAQMVVSHSSVTEDLDCGYQVIRTWSAEDACGNEVEMTQTVTYIDETSPEVTSTPEDLDLLCGESFPMVEPTFTDNCNGVITVEFDENEVINADTSREITRTWTASDECGNETQTVQVINLAACGLNIGDFVFYDNDRDGVQDADEDGVEGVTVELVSAGDDGAYGTADDVVEETVVTDENGEYLFEEVLGGEYIIVFSDLPADYVFSPADQGGDDTADSDATETGATEPFTVVSGQEDDLTFDAGINLPTASLGDLVFEDENQNGIQDEDEGGIEGVEVTLYLCDGTELATTETDENGAYIFEGLEPNQEYYVVFGQPEGYEPSPQDAGGDDTADSDANEAGQTDCVELAPGENEDTLDAGFYIPTSIGDFVFYDNDRDGVQDADEDGVEGVTVELVSAGDDGAYGTADDVVEETVVTDENGEYLFEEVLGGEYIIVFSDLPADYVFSPADQGGDNTADSDATETGATEPFTVVSGQEDDLTFDAGINLPTASLGDLVFEDENQNGIQDEDEGGIEGVEVTLYLCDGTELATTETDENGAYIFADLEPNQEYYVVFGQPEGYESSPANQGGDDALDSDANEAGQTECVELAPDENNEDLDAGFFQPINIGDLVFYDNNTDGIQDTDEEGVEGVDVQLISAGPDGEFHTADDVLVDTQTTDENGAYLFEDVALGEYCIQFVDTTLPAEYLFTSQNQGGDDEADSDTDVTGKTEPFSVVGGQEDDLSWDAGISLCTLPELVGTAPADVTILCTESAPAAPTVEFTDDLDSDLELNFTEEATLEGCNEVITRTWSATNYCGGTISVVQVITSVDDIAPTLIGVPADEALQCGEEPTPAIVVAQDNCTAQMVVSHSSVTEDLDCGYQVIRTWSAEDACGNEVEMTQTVTYIDETSPEVTSTPEDLDLLCGESFPMVEPTFTDNCNGVITVEFDENEVINADTSREITRTWTASDECGNETQTVQVINLAACGLNIGDFVFYDNDRDGVQDADEDGVEGVTVELVSAGADGVFGTADDVVEETVVTDENGEYLFEEVLGGEYIIVFSDLPADYVFSPADQGGDNTADSDATETGATEPFTVVSGQEDDLTFDAGINLPTASLGDLVFEDENQNGIQDEDEGGIEGVEVTLYLCDGTELATTETDENGAYIFADLEPNQEYYVVFGQPEGYESSPANQGGDDALDSDANEAGQTDCVELAPGENEDTLDAGFYIPTSIGDFVFYDNDRDGVQDADEDGVEGVTVELVSAGDDGVFGTADDVVEETVVTDENGEYLFEEVLAGEYIIVFSDLPADYVFSPADQGGDDTADSDATETGATEPFTVTYGQEDDLTFDAGINLPTASLGDLVFEDENQNGIQDEDEGGIEGVEVTLYLCDGTELATTETDENGAYIFADLEPNQEYYVVFGQPEGYESSPANQGGDDALDSDANEAGQTDCVELAPGENDDTLDAGFFQPINIGDLVFYDNNTDGIQDTDEEGVEGVDVQLISAGPDGEFHTADDVLVDTQTTDENGAYLFEDVALGDYCIQFVDTTLPAEYLFTSQNQGGDDEADSDTDVTGKTEPFSVVGGQENDLSWDAGISLCTLPELVGTAPADVTILCTESAPAAPTVEFTDDLDSDLELNFTEEATLEGCNEVITRTWSATNYCGGTLSVVQVITSVDDIAPTLIGVPADEELACGAEPASAIVVAQDNCDDNITVSLTSVTNELDCGYEIVRTWSAEDACGNEVSAAQTSTYTDSTAPVSTFVPADYTIECDEEMTLEDAAFTDNCEGEIQILYSEEAVNETNCGYEFVRVWRGIDDCGNQTIAAQTITVVDTTAPELLNVPADTNAECDAIPAPENVTATDNCNDNVVVDFTETVTEGCPYTITRTWTATDACGNTASQSQLITVTDTEAPVLNGVPESLNATMNNIPAVAVVTATDNCSDVEVEFTETENDLACGYQIVRTWSAEDECGNTTSDSQTITVSDDTPPVISSEPADVTVECGEDIPASTATFTDESDTDLELDFSEVTNQLACGYEIVRTWSATDDCENSTTAEQVITVVDTTAPTLIGVPADEELACGAEPASAIVVAQDNCDDNITVSLTSVTNELDCGYEIVRTWSAEDACGNEVSAAQTSTYTDSTAPVSTFVPADYTIECDEEMTLEDATFTDNCEGEIQILYSEEAVNETDCGYEFVRVWRGIDDCGNQTIATQTITVVDTTAPEFTNIPVDMEISCDAITTPDTVTATDNCDQEVDVSFDQEFNGGTCPFTIVRTWTATDDCGNESTLEQVLTVVDNEAPVLVGVPENVNVTVGNIPEPANITAQDNCSAVNVEFSEVENQLACGYELVRTWFAADGCNNEVSASQTITVSDNVPPTAANPEDLTVECGDEIPVTEVIFTDDFDTDLVLSSDEVTTPADCGFEILRTWTATDACGNTTTVDQLITVVDTTAPVLFGVPSDTALQCGEEVPSAIITATDNCDEQVTVSLTSETNDLDCGYEVIRTWIAIDACGNQVSASQTSTYVDSTNPVASNEPVSTTIECGDDIPFEEPSFTDNCEDELEIEFSETNANITSCGYDIIRTWTAADVCGNETVVSQTITILDTTAPLLIGVPADEEVNCHNIPDPALVSASDICDDNVQVDFSETSTEGCPYTITRTWTATDGCGNTASVTQTLTVVDNESPVISSEPADLEIECGDTIPVGEATFTDNCDSSVEVTASSNTETNPCGSVITNTWTAVDECGNETTATQVITVIDTTAPVFDSEIEDQEFECGNIPEAAQLTASDNCSEATVTVSDEVLETACGITVTRTYTATDACGNQATLVQTLTSNDSESPVASNEPENLILSCEETVPTNAPTFTDNCTEEVTVVYTAEVTDESVCGFTQINTWVATDACGNQTVVSQTITVADTTAPVFVSTLEDITVECNSIPSPVMLEATDNCDQVVDVTVEQEMDAMACPYNITRTWTATDDCGNATEYVQTITVQDTTAPTLAGVPADVTVECTAIPEVASVTASDNCDFNLNVLFEETTTTNGCIVTITRTWTVADNCDNMDQQSQVITVVDNTAPVLQNVPTDTSAECSSIPEPADVTAIDDCTENVEVELVEQIESLLCGYNLIRIWTATDACGNQSTAQQIIQVNDTQAPEISNVPEGITVECDQLPPFGTVDAVDACGSFINIQTSESQVAQDCGFLIVRVWTATDACGNSATASQEITVLDTTPPVLLNVPADVIVSCTEVPEAAEVDAADNCDDELVLSVTDEFSMDGCNTIISRIYRATDNCGNQAIATQTITVVDEEAPVLSEAPAYIEVECGEIPEPAILTAIDNCDDDVDITFTQEYTGVCNYDIIRTWTATDNCGNTDVQTQTIHVVDTTGPDFGAYETEVFVTCGELSSYEITVTDLCDDDVDLTYEDVYFSGGCFGVVQRTWTATDLCGNTTSALQFIRQLDEELPVLINVPEDITVECGEDIPAIDFSVSATDNCDDDVDITFIEEVTSEFCPYVITRTWIAEDECGNIAEETQVITIDIETPEQVSIFSYPNPFNDSFTVNFSVPQNSNVSAKVVDGMGRTVSVVFDGQADGARLYEYTLSGLNWEPGSYTLMMVVGENVHHHKLMVQNN